MAVGTACRYLGVTNPQLFKDALKAYDEAIARDSTNQEAQLREIELFLDKYNSGDAKKSVAALLAKNPRHPRALLASARVTYFDGSGAAADIVRKSLEVNPNAAPAARVPRLHLSSTARITSQRRRRRRRRSPRTRRSSRA